MQNVRYVCRHGTALVDGLVACFRNTAHLVLVISGERGGARTHTHTHTHTRPLEVVFLQLISLQTRGHTVHKRLESKQYDDVSSSHYP